MRIEVMMFLKLACWACMDRASTSLKRRTPWKAIAALFAVAVIWGGTFVWMKDAVTVAEARLGPGHVLSGLSVFLALRFGAAALIVLAISRSARTRLGAAEWKYGAWLGGLLFGGFALQMSGLVDVSPAVSAFLTSLYVLFTAAISALSAGGRPRATLVAGALLATLGAGLVRGRPGLTFTVGEWLTIGSAIIFAIHIIATDRATRRFDPMALTFTSFVVVFGLAAITFLAVSTSDDAPSSAAIVDLVTSRAFFVPLALTTVLATVVALTFMNLFQREVDPVRAAILYAFEPIWATLFGIATAHDSLTPWFLFGGAALLAGNLIAELGARRESAST
jgi:drug/metabolite transporter (DMT)-like permease